jgi:DNA-binding transcriptional LysR family regulator
MACQGRGVAFLNRLGIEDELRRKLLVHLPLKKTQPSLLGIYVRAGRSLPPAIDHFCHLAAQQMEQGQAS